MLQDNGALKTVLFQPVDKGEDSFLITGRRAGEEGQMAVGVTVIFVDMDVVDRDAVMNPGQVAEVIIPGGIVKIGMTQIQAESDMPSWWIFFLQEGEKQVYIFRGGGGNILNGEKPLFFMKIADQGNDGF